MVESTVNPCDPIIKLSVGFGRDTVQVHQGVLCKTSDFFKNAMKPEWASRKADPHTLHLPDHTLEDANLYARWLYSEKLIVDTDIYNDHAKADRLYRTLIYAYIYIFKALVKALMVHNLVPGHHLIKILYDGSSPGCLARSLVTRVVAHGISFTTESRWHKEIQGYPRDALVDLVEALSTLRGREATSRTWCEIEQEFLGRI